MGCGCDDEDAVEDGVCEKALKDVPLAVDLSGIDLVEQGHHDESVEDDGEVLRRRRVQGRVHAGVDVENFVAWEGK